jgi:serine protease AprX
VLEKGLALLPDASSPIGHEDGLFRISVKRRPEPACLDSIRTVKADAARRVFAVDTSGICWAVLDSGIDALHPALSDDNGKSRVTETYDFTKVRRLLALASTPGDAAESALQDEFGISAAVARQIRTTLAAGGDVDWGALKPALQIRHTPDSLTAYAKNLSAHGTHVAGILAGRPTDVEGEGEFCGMCPEMRLIDVRILDQNEAPGEFDIIAALQFIRYLNSSSDDPVVHGVNLSIQLQHNPRDYACGRTPVCEECNRLVASGVIAVAAAGNLGIESGSAADPTTEGSFRDISIADPSNADSVITVGSTHRKRPHAYGVSYFSSRGPTGDGRQKPDLVAPGEKILGPVPNAAYKLMEGTSMAAPHVSGAAALLLARHSELIGDVDRIKQILCDTARKVLWSI